MCYNDSSVMLVQMWAIRTYLHTTVRQESEIGIMGCLAIIGMIIWQTHLWKGKGIWHQLADLLSSNLTPLLA